MKWTKILLESTKLAKAGAEAYHEVETGEETPDGDDDDTSDESSDEEKPYWCDINPPEPEPEFEFKEEEFDFTDEPADEEEEPDYWVDPAGNLRKEPPTAEERRRWERQRRINFKLNGGTDPQPGYQPPESSYPSQDSDDPSNESNDDEEFSERAKKPDFSDNKNGHKPDDSIEIPEGDRSIDELKDILFDE